jgi:ACS family hexuronate transporter-like MFS transporter
MFASTILNYMDRQTLSLVRPQIRETFAITADADFGWVLSAFIMTYALFQVPAGYLVDRFDLRWSYAAAVAWWSLAAIATAIAPTLGVLIVCRMLLGVGESFNWPCALGVTGRILPAADRSLGNGIFNSGAAVGAVVTPVVVTFMTPVWGWRTTFLVIGSAGFVWVAAWLILIQGEKQALLAAPDHERRGREASTARLSAPALTAFGGVAAASVVIGLSAFRFGQESLWLAIAVAMFGVLFVSAILPRHQLAGADWAASLGDVVRHRRFWILVVVSVSINICWHFLINWIPAYLKDERGLTYQTSNFSSAIPFLAADFGNIGGGWMSRNLAARGLRPFHARVAVMAFCCLLILSGIAVGFVRGNVSALILLSIMAAGTAAFMANYFAFTQEVSALHSGLIVGYLGGLGNLFVARFQPFAGWVKDTTGSFSVIFVLIGLAPLIGLATLILGWEGRRPVDELGGETE